MKAGDCDILTSLLADANLELQDAETANQMLKMNFLAQAESAANWKKRAEEGQQGAGELLSATLLSAIIG